MSHDSSHGPGAQGNGKRQRARTLHHANLEEVREVMEGWDDPAHSTSPDLEFQVSHPRVLKCACARALVV